MYKLILCVLLIIRAVFASAQGRVIGADGAYSFSKDGKYGMCDRSKNTILKAMYRKITRSGPFYVAEQETGQYDVCSTDGKLLGTASIVQNLDDSTLLLCRFDAPYSNYYDKYERSRSVIYLPETGPHPKALILHANGALDSLPGIVISRSASQFIVDSAGYRGIVTAWPMKYLLPIRYKELKAINGFYLGWNDSSDYCMADQRGKQYPAPLLVKGVKAISLGGHFFVKDSGQTGSNVSYYNSRGLLIYKGEGMYTAFKSLADTPSIFIRTHAFGDVYLDTMGHLHPEYADAYRPLTGEGYGDINIAIHKVPDSLRGRQHNWNNGIYNSKTKQYVLTAPSDTAVRIWRGHAAIYALSKGMLTAYDGHGNEISRIPFNQMKGVDDRNYTRDFYGAKAFRNTTTEPFTVYNGDLTEHYPVLFDDVWYGNGNMEFTGKKNGLWGLYRIVSPKDPNAPRVTGSGTIVEVIPPMYDTIICTNMESMYKVTSKGKSFWLDRSGNVILGGKSFDWLGAENSDGHRLAFDVTYEQPADITYNKIMLVDKNGEVLYTLDPKPAGIYWRFYPFKDDRVFCYARQGGAVIWHARTGKITHITGNQEMGLPDNEGPVACTDNGPVAVIVKNAENQEGVFSLLEEKMIIPFGKFSQLECFQYNKTSVAFKTNPFNDDHVLVIYDENGSIY